MYKLAALPQEGFLAPSHMVDPARLVDLPPQPDHLLLPSISVDTPVKEVFFVDDEWQVAEYAAGYLNGTALPGEVGNMVFSGHAGLFGGVFANLHTLAVNDDVYVDAAGWRYHYRVRKTLVVWPTQSEFLLPTDIPTMTLITCTNWDLQRVVVIADLIGSRPL
jgi:sortase A